MAALKRFRATGPSFADLVPYAGLVDNGVLLLKDGSLMAGWYFAGPDSESATDLERNELSRQTAFFGSFSHPGHRSGSNRMIATQENRHSLVTGAVGAGCGGSHPFRNLV